MTSTPEALLRQPEGHTIVRPPKKRPELNDVKKAYRKVFGSPEGKMVLEHICKGICNLDQTVTLPAPHSTEDQAARCAQFDIGRTIERLVYSPIEGTDKPKVKR